MKQQKKFSINHALYVKRLRNENILVWFLRFFILIAFLGFWELFAYTGVIDSFITSSPSIIIKTIKTLFTSDNLTYHIGITLYETLLGFVIASGVGYLIALMLWWSERLRKILEPYIVVLNSLPKIALGPILIIWIGIGTKAIVAMDVLIMIIITTLSMFNSFSTCDENKILL